jgi:hypothetical protein
MKSRFPEASAPVMRNRHGCAVGATKEKLIVRVKDRSLVVPFAAAVFVLASSALAQTSGYPDVPDHFRIEVGGFRIGSDTQLETAGAGGRPPVDFEGLNVPDTATRFYIEGFWRPWRRHQFSLSWYNNDRDGDPKTVERDFAWGDRVITAGATVQAHVGSSYVSGVYRFAAYKNDKFEIGPSIGIGHLSLDAGISGQGSVTSGGVTTTEPFDESRSIGQITGDVGGYFYWWPARRLMVRADMRYIIVKPGDSEASVTDGRASAVYHFTRTLGVGLQYVYTKFRYDRDALSSELGGSLRYQGGQLVLSAAF